MYLCRVGFIVGYAYGFVANTASVGLVQKPSTHLSNGNTFVKHQGSSYITKQHTCTQNYRRSVSPVQTMGLFGLGVPEIAIIAVAAVFVLGPENIGKLGREAGKMSSEFKDIPAEFQKGIEEGEIEARSKRAKQMDDPNK